VPVDWLFDFDISTILKIAIAFVLTVRWTVPAALRKSSRCDAHAVTVIASRWFA
jgi:hypothetical protein